MIRWILPHGLVKLIDWRSRLRRTGMAATEASFGALCERTRRALLESRREILPFEYGKTLNCVIDVGANEGQWSVAIRRFFDIENHVLFEPNPDAYEQLSKLLGGKDGVVHLNCAVGARDGAITLNVTRGSSLASVLNAEQELLEWYGTQAEVVQQVQAAVCRLDDVELPGGMIDLLKVDVQGFERDVFEGAREVLKRTRSVLVELTFERHYEGDMLYYELAQYLEREQGFSFWDMSPPERRDSGRALWADACFVRRKAL